MRAEADRTLGAVLAGGAGSRVGGADKGLLPLLGRPLTEHVLAALRPQCDALLVVANRNLGEYAAFAPAIHDQNLGHHGPLAGLAAACRFLVANNHARISWLLTLPVDCPAPPCNLAGRLRTALDAHAAATCAFARHAGKAQPLFALYRIANDAGSWHASAQSALVAHGSPRRWQAALNAVAVDFDADGAVFHNLNTPHDFGEYERMHAAN